VDVGEGEFALDLELGVAIRAARLAEIEGDGIRARVDVNKHRRRIHQRDCGRTGNKGQCWNQHLVTRSDLSQEETAELRRLVDDLDEARDA